MGWGIVLSSAAIGALVATLGQILGQVLERRHRERELVFRFSVEAARAKREDLLKVRDLTGGEVHLRDPLYAAAQYYPLVHHLLRCGYLPEDAPPEHSRREPE